MPRALASAPFDGEGVATKRRTLVAKGVLQGLVLSSYSARRLGVPTTANAGGVHNLLVRPTAGPLAEIVAGCDEAFVVGELLGQGVNIVTGDYSRGAAGFWVERGKIVHPVHEVTLAGNLPEMFQRIQAVGSDVDARHRALRRGARRRAHARRRRVRPQRRRDLRRFAVDVGVDDVGERARPERVTDGRVHGVAECPDGLVPIAAGACISLAAADGVQDVADADPARVLAGSARWSAVRVSSPAFVNDSMTARASRRGTRIRAQRPRCASPARVYRSRAHEQHRR
jgi:hypothetical protein